MSYFLHLLIYLSLYTIGALSLNLVAGFSGLLVLSYAAYFAVGCYVYALTTVFLDWPFFAGAALGMVISMLLSLAVAIPACRFSGDMFALVSLAVQTVFFSVFYNWTSPSKNLGSIWNLTNGPLGIAGISRPRVFGHTLTRIGEVAFLSVLIAGVCALVTWLLVASPWGRLLKSVRDDELAARGLGKVARHAKIEVFAASCSLAGLAGALYAAYTGYVDPSVAALDQSILMLSVVIVGGLGNFRGPIVGALTLLVIPEFLRFLDLTQSTAATLRLLIYGALLLVMIHFRPQGLAGEYRLE